MFDDDDSLLIMVGSLVALGAAAATYHWTSNLMVSLMAGFLAFWPGIVMAILAAQWRMGLHHLDDLLIPDLYERFQSAQAHINLLIRDHMEATITPLTHWKGAMIVSVDTALAPPHIRVRFDDDGHYPMPLSIKLRVERILVNAGPNRTFLHRWAWRRNLRRLARWTSTAPRYSAHAVLAARHRLQHDP